MLESVPTISVEKTDGCQMYLSKENKPEIITAKSSEMNVIIPTDDDDYVSFHFLMMIKICHRLIVLSQTLVFYEQN